MTYQFGAYLGGIETQSEQGYIAANVWFGAYLGGIETLDNVRG